MSKYAKIEAAPVEERYARGWHCLGKASDYSAKPARLSYFGKNLVAFRGVDDQLIILDGYCPHMGADLAEGYVEGNSIRCSMHGWRWGEDGVCDDIPYAKKIPPRACIKHWPVLERNGLAYVYHDPEDNPPKEEEMPPVIEAYGSEEWSDWEIELIPIETNCRELVDNMADKAHFGPVHSSEALSFKNTFHKHICVQEMESKTPRLAGDSILKTVATYYGPSYMITEMTGEMDGVPVESKLLVCHIPTSTESFDLRFGVMVKKFPGISQEDCDAMVKGYVQLSQQAFFEDVHFWHTKVRVDNPVLCDGDGPIHKLRQWYNQFYVDVADVPPTWNEPKTYNVESVNPIPPQKVALDDLRAAEYEQQQAAAAEA
ncbi:MAG: Rieske 2Fe-2S domain-containing protein [Pseudomonadales bacterium]|nr:Rieske 2Fe-2S domain-containing protein [Pseudomonadales bacterium]